tara:strand:+ start:292 stop:966 length:675 start_codon:yes stop_codon:yes gene_type:complete
MIKINYNTIESTIYKELLYNSILQGKPKTIIDGDYFNHFIAVFDNSISDENCEIIINYYNNSMNTYPGVTAGGLNKCIKDTTDLKVEKNTIVDKILYNSLNQYLKKYSQECSTYLKSNGIPEDIILKNLTDTGYQIQKYKKNEGKYIWHHDFSLEPNKYRHLTFLWYLNDNDNGFTELIDIAIRPKKGRLLLFPSSDIHLHRGCYSLNSDKYICTGWLYVDQSH